MTDQALIDLRGIRKIFFTEEIETHALSNIELKIRKGEYVSVAGPSGCGKSTLLAIIGLLDVPTGGEYRLSDHSVVDLNSGERARIRNREVGFIFQSFNLISSMTVQENVELPLTYRSDLTKAEVREMAHGALGKVDMQHRSRHYPSQLSGGQQQRAAVARAIAGKPSLLLADEPTGNLDTKNAEAVMELLEKLHAEGSTICMVTHDPRSAERAERLVEILDGSIIADNPITAPLKEQRIQAGI
jgi:putative ABC transport system ATP-binding protein